MPPRIRIRSRRLGALLLAQLLLACGAEVTGPDSRPTAALEEVTPGLAYARWFTRATGIVPDSAEFAAYALRAVDDRLFAGFGATRPNRGDGSLLAVVGDTTLRAVGVLDEQGFADMTGAGEALLVPGVDPCCGDDWAFGNLYRYHPEDGFTKRRNMPDVLHAFGVWYDPRADGVYVATGSHMGDEETWSGAIWTSPDRGETWRLVADRSDGVGEARTYDVLGSGGRLHAVRADGFDGRCGLVVRRSSGRWKPLVPDGRVACWPRILEFRDDVLVPDPSRAGLRVVEDDGQSRLSVLPAPLPQAAIHWGVVVGDLLYVITGGGDVFRSADLRSWETVVTSERSLVAVEYWSDRGWLVLSGIGASVGLWRVDVARGG